MVNAQVPKKNTVKGSLSLEVKCLIYATGPWNIPKANTKSNEPTDQSIPNFLGLMANTGNRNTHSVKHAAEPKMKHTNKINLSVRDKLNQAGSSSWIRSCLETGSLE